MSVSRLALAATLACGLLSSSQAQSRRIYLRQAPEEEREQLAELEAALAKPDPDVPQTAAAIAELLASTGDEATRNGLVASDPLHHRGLRARLVDALPELPAAILTGVREGQSRTAAQAMRGDRPPGDQELVSRFPASTLAAEAAKRLWQRAFERADLGRCLRISDELLRLHPAQLDTPQVRSLLELNAQLVQRASASYPSSATRLLLRGEETLSQQPKEAYLTHSPSFPLQVGDRVCVSNGAVIRVFSLQGAPLGSIPGHPAAAADPPPNTTRFQARLAQWGGLVFSPLVLEGWLAPARKRPDVDGSLANRFHSLVTLDPERARILWWDGDGGPRTPPPTDSGGDEALAPTPPPPGLAGMSASLSTDLATGHVIAVAADSARVYVALTIKGDEPKLSIMAFARDTGATQAFVLRPAWTQTTQILAAERAEGSAENAPVAVEIAASLALDGRGRLICTTDLSLAACLDAGTGDLLWTHQDRKSSQRAGSFTRRRGRTNPGAGEPPPEPARFVQTPEGERLAVAFVGARLLGLRLRDGARRWALEADGRGAAGPRLPQQRATRLARVGRNLVAYGGNVAFTFTETGTRLQTVHLSSRCRGEGVVLGESLLLPLQRGTRLELKRFYLGGERKPPLTMGVLPGVAEPANLFASSRGVVAATRSRVLFLNWQ